MSKKILSLFLASVILLTTFAVAFTAVSADGNTIDYGVYPQTKVTDESLKNQLDNLESDSNNDVILNGVKYARYENDYYKYEPISWKIIQGDFGTIYVSEKILDAKPLTASGSAGTYGSSYSNTDLANWLNVNFKNAAFPGALSDNLERNVETFDFESFQGRTNRSFASFENVASVGSKYSERYYCCLPSISDIKSYTEDLEGEISEAKTEETSSGTDFAYAKGFTDNSYYLRNADSNNNWWFVNADGIISAGAGSSVRGVRPVIVFDFDKRFASQTVICKDADEIYSVSVNTAPLADGKTFDHWDPDISNSDEKVLWASPVWKYTLSFDTGIDGNTIDSVDYFEGDTITWPDYTKLNKYGKKCTGWKVDGHGFNPETMPAESIKAVAEWVDLDTYTISFYDVSIDKDNPAHDAFIRKESSFNQVSHYVGYDIDDVADITLEDNDESYFNGWKIVGEESKEEYPEFPEKMPAENLIVTAVREKKYYINVFCSKEFNNDDTEPDYSIPYRYGDDIEALEDPVKSGYKFGGWELWDSDEYFDSLPETMPEENIGAEAIWLNKEYAVNWINNDEVVKFGYYSVDDILDFPVIEDIEGYLFLGWSNSYENRVLETPDYINPAVADPDNLIEEITFTAEWAKIHKASFLLNGHEIYASYGISGNDEFNIPAGEIDYPYDIEDYGYRLNGWINTTDEFEHCYFPDYDLVFDADCYPITEINIWNRDEFNNRTLMYNTTITFRPIITDPYAFEDSVVYWEVIGAPFIENIDGSCTVLRAKNNYSVRCYTFNGDGERVYSPYENINIKNRFIDIIISFVKSLFNPTINIHIQ